MCAHHSCVYIFICCEAPLLQCVAGQCPLHHKTTCGLKKIERCQPHFPPKKINIQGLSNLLHRFMGKKKNSFPIDPFPTKDRITTTHWECHLPALTNIPSQLQTKKHSFETARVTRGAPNSSYINTNLKYTTCINLPCTTEQIWTKKTTPIPPSLRLFLKCLQFPSHFYQGSVGHHGIHGVVPSGPC